MKHFLSILAAISIPLFLEAMPTETEQPNSQGKVSFFTVKVQSTPPVEFLKFSTEKKIIIDESIICRTINMKKGSKYNDLTLQTPLHLDFDLDDISFLLSIFYAFGGTSCKYGTGTVDRDIFESFLNAGRSPLNTKANISSDDSE